MSQAATEEPPLYIPSDWGRLYHSLDVDELLGAGAAGPGKTQVLIMEPLAQIHMENERCRNKKHPHPLKWGMSKGCALFLRREFTLVQDTIRRTMRIYPQIDPGATFDKQTLTWTFSSGYRVRFGHCKDEGDWQNYYTDEFTLLLFDEANQFTLEQFEQINTRLRTSDPVLRKMLKCRLMSNPGNCRDARNPDWVRRRFVDPAPTGRVVMKKKVTRRDGTVKWLTRMYLPASLFDNPDKEFVADYEARLLARPAHIRQELLYGNWYATAGSYFGEDWNPQIHVVEPFEIPSDWPRFRAMDWGFKTNGTILWFAMDYDENLYCYREFSFKEMSAAEVAKRVKSYEQAEGMWKRKRSRLTGPADTQLWEKRGESGLSKAEEFEREGVSWKPADKRSRARNAERLLERLKDHRGGTCDPGVMFFKTCTKCIQTIPTIGVDEDDSEAPAKSGDDHWLDTTMYACAYASRGPAAIGSLPDDDTKDDDDDFTEPDAKRSERGRYGYGSSLM